MDELFRYLQLRQSQKIADEQKRSVGLSLYPDTDYSTLAKSLIEINKGKASSETVRGVVERHIHTEKPIADPANLTPAIRATYHWLNFKARPFKTAHFAAFIDERLGSSLAFCIPLSESQIPWATREPSAALVLAGRTVGFEIPTHAPFHMRKSHAKTRLADFFSILVGGTAL